MVWGFVRVFVRISWWVWLVLALLRDGDVFGQWYDGVQVRDTGMGLFGRLGEKYRVTRIKGSRSCYGVMFT